MRRLPECTHYNMSNYEVEKLRKNYRRTAKKYTQPWKGIALITLPVTIVFGSAASLLLLKISVFLALLPFLLLIIGILCAWIWRQGVLRAKHTRDYRIWHLGELALKVDPRTTNKQDMIDLMNASKKLRFTHVFDKSCAARYDEILLEAKDCYSLGVSSLYYFGGLVEVFAYLSGTCTAAVFALRYLSHFDPPYMHPETIGEADIDEEVATDMGWPREKCLRLHQQLYQLCEGYLYQEIKPEKFDEHLYQAFLYEIDNREEEEPVPQKKDYGADYEALLKEFGLDDEAPDDALPLL